jgi:hypothetical protein
MCEKIFLISNTVEDEEALKGILGSDKYKITTIPPDMG